mmetsp:Transcript_31217/g.78991  ORF Transcript_31217/g.78991 Transcript_31217/m.78991 type:complete len:301 (+) Transcript_31217:136-1038(+)
MLKDLHNPVGHFACSHFLALKLRRNGTHASCQQGTRHGHSAMRSEVTSSRKRIIRKKLSESQWWLPNGSRAISLCKAHGGRRWHGELSRVSCWKSCTAEQLPAIRTCITALSQPLRQTTLVEGVPACCDLYEICAAAAATAATVRTIGVPRNKLLQANRALLAALRSGLAGWGHGPYRRRMSLRPLRERDVLREVRDPLCARPLRTLGIEDVRLCSVAAAFQASSKQASIGPGVTFQGAQHELCCAAFHLDDLAWRAPQVQAAAKQAEYRRAAVADCLGGCPMKITVHQHDMSPTPLQPA